LYGSVLQYHNILSCCWYCQTNAHTKRTALRPGTLQHLTLLTIKEMMRSDRLPRTTIVAEWVSKDKT
jgi:hypothetical protein